MAGRKRVGTGAASGAAKKARPAAYGTISAGAMNAIAKKTAGYVRTGGYYGRFSGTGKELKFFDTATSFAVDTTAEVPATGQLVLIPQGVTESTRVGRKCVIKSISGRWDMVYAPASGATAVELYAIYLVLDKQCNGAAAAFGDVFLGTSATQGLHNLANSQRFVILKKWVGAMTSPAGVTTAYNSVVKHVDFFKKCNIPIEYSSTTGAITEIRSNNIFLIAGGSHDDALTVTGNVRVRFSDGS